ncbi:MAG: hypothetical protein A2Y31_05635 [Spirochaetes bacterium GWC2_52_13]|nr:MAG: hypothetical protein A2Y31_05635 [Spirochaetes bacterium GWC2_52_13]HCG62604.1 hypothetical protein [Sphaerochaeta sp.]
MIIKEQIAALKEKLFGKQGILRNHAVMMILCCGLPILLVLLLSGGILSLPAALVPYIWMLCPILMLPMMFMHSRSSHHNHHDHGEKEIENNPDNNRRNFQGGGIMMDSEFTSNDLFEIPEIRQNDFRLETEQRLKALNGVEQVVFHPEGVRVSYNPQLIDAETIRGELDRLGLAATGRNQ